jgi:ribulose-phosphate 3-epimerase
VEADTRENTLACIEKIRSLGVKPGIVVKPNTSAQEIAEFLPLVDMVLVMTVEPGFGGQKFMADMMPKVKQLRAMLDEVNPSCHLEVDGGVDLVTGQVCKENGADVLVAGSAFFGSKDRPAFVKSIEA